MKVYIYKGRTEKCFTKLEKACEYAIKDMLSRFSNIEFVGNAKWVEEEGLRKYKLYFNNIGKDCPVLCAYIKELEVIK